MNPSNGTYNFGTFDQWMLRAQSSGQDVMFTAFLTPSWASSRGKNCVSVGSPAGCLGPPNTSCAFNSIYGPGLCDPPNDINCDGSGTDQHFINFVNALLNHVGPGKIKYWEMWNEPNVSKEWNADADCPSTPHANQLILARMAHDLRTTVSASDSNALFTTPAATNSLTNVSTWMNGYFTYTNGASFADIIAFHGYIQTGQCPSDCPIPEHVLTLIGKVKAVIPSGQQSKPLFDTEGSWGGVPGGANGITDPDQQATFLSRYFLLQMGAGISKLYWYGWDFTGSGFLYDPNTHSLTLAGYAYNQIVDWTTGKNVQPCVSNSTQWSCAIGTDTKAIWDTSQTCGSGSCTTINVSVPSQFTSYIDLSGAMRPVTNSVVPVGAKPILLVSSSISRPAPPSDLTGVVH